MAGVTGFSEGFVTNRFHRATGGTKGGHGLYFDPILSQAKAALSLEDAAPSTATVNRVNISVAISLCIIAGCGSFAAVCIDSLVIPSLLTFDAGLFGVRGNLQPSYWLGPRISKSTTLGVSL